jgi:hypothetical protein
VSTKRLRRPLPPTQRPNVIMCRWGMQQRRRGASAVVRIVASDLADRPWIPIAAAVFALTFVTVAIWRSAWIALAAFGGAIIGAVAFMPVGTKFLDGPADCRSCSTYITVLMGASFRTPYNGPRTAAISATVLGCVFGLAAWGLTMLRRDK